MDPRAATMYIHAARIFDESQDIKSFEPFVDSYSMTVRRPYGTNFAVFCIVLYLVFTMGIPNTNKQLLQVGRSAVAVVSSCSKRVVWKINYTIRRKTLDLLQDFAK